MQETKQRGSKQSIQLVLHLYTLFGYKFIYYFMYPITFFYFLIASNVKKSLKNYYKHLNVEFTSKVYYNHLRMFSVSMVDRFISKIHPEDYDFRYESNEVPVNTLASGGVLVYSHFGGWAASSMGSHVTNKINIVMQETMLSDIKSLETNLEQKLEVNVIDIHKGSIAVSVEIANALMNEEIVVIMADRASNEKAESEVLFLGEKAKFNKNPFQVAYKVDKPVLAYFIIWTDIQQYKVEYIHIVMDKNKKEEEAVTEALETYVEKFEEIVRLYPSQWFNLYNFWEKK